MASLSTLILLRSVSSSVTFSKDVLGLQVHSLRRQQPSPIAIPIQLSQATGALHRAGSSPAFQSMGPQRTKSVKESFVPALMAKHIRISLGALTGSAAVPTLVVTIFMLLRPTRSKDVLPTVLIMILAWVWFSWVLREARCPWIRQPTVSQRALLVFRHHRLMLPLRSGCLFRLGFRNGHSRRERVRRL